jgi:hypothetical protein
MQGLRGDMKKNRINIRPEGSLEAIVSLGPVIQALKKGNPDAEFSIVAEDCFREAAALVPGVDSFSTSVPDGEELYDFSHSPGESWGRESVDWKAYLQGCAPLIANPYHQIDLLRKCAELDQTDVNFDLMAPSLEEGAVPETVSGGDSLRIALCASSLSINELQSVLEGISRLEIPAVVHMLGTVPDRRKSSLLLSAWEGRVHLVDLCGRQALAQMAETLRLCDITIAAPGVSALISSGYGTFTICVDESRNPLHYPYGHGHLIVQHTDSEEFFPALSRLTTDIVHFALRGNGGNIPSLGQWQEFADERMDNFLSRVRFFATQRIEVLEGESSFTELYLKPLIYLGAEYEDVLRSFYRLLWENSLRGRNVEAGDLEILHQNAMNRLCSDLKPLEQLYEIANFGRTFSLYVKDSLTKADQTKAQQDAMKLQETEELVHAMGRSTSALAPLALHHEKRQRLLPEIDPIELSAQMSQQFADMQSRVLVLLDLSKTLFHTTLQNEAPAAVLEENPSHGQLTD